MQIVAARLRGMRRRLRAERAAREAGERVRRLAPDGRILYQLVADLEDVAVAGVGVHEVVLCYRLLRDDYLVGVGGERGRERVPRVCNQMRRRLR